jgi:hypothetical protein
VTGPRTETLAEQIAEATSRMATWLRTLPEWPSHPVNATETVSAHFGPTLLSEHDCILHYARFLSDAGVPWEDVHLELSPGKWMYDTPHGAKPKRIDLAIMRRDRLAAATLPAAAGALPLDAVFEFALASNYWRHGIGSRRALRDKVDTDVAKVAEYLRSGLATRGYVVIVEEADHGFPDTYAEHAGAASGVEVVLLQQWQPG